MFDYSPNETPPDAIGDQIAKLAHDAAFIRNEQQNINVAFQTLASVGPSSKAYANVYVAIEHDGVVIHEAPLYLEFKSEEPQVINHFKEIVKESNRQLESQIDKIRKNILALAGL